MSTPAILAVIATLAPATPVRLTLTYDPGDGRPAQVARVFCRASGDEVTGYLRAVGTRRACRAARRRATLLTHAPEKGRVCDQIFGGPERARVRGMIGTAEVHRRLGRSDGCQIAEWDALVPLVPPHRIQGLSRGPSG